MVKRPSDGWKAEAYRTYFEEAAKLVDPDEDQLAHSRRMRELIIADYGELPTSILPYRPEGNYDDPAAQGRNTLSDSHRDGGDLYGGQKGEDSLGRLSVFEGHLARTLVRLYSNPGDLVLDPFAGRAARLQAALELDRRYVGFDLSPVAVDACQQVIKEQKASRKAKVHLMNSMDQRKKVEAGSAQLVLTCPPYGWSEFYGDNGSGLEAAPDYHDFIEELAACLLLSGESLEEDRFLVVVIRGWFLHKNFVDPAAHLERYMAAAGYTFHDRAVHKMSTSRERFHSDVVNWRRTAQVHEDVLVWQKRKPRRVGTYQYHARTLDKNEARREQEDKLWDQRREELARLLPVDPADCLPYVTQPRP